MKITKIITGAIRENCYILSKNGYALIIDPGDEAEKIIDKITALDVYPVSILLTHAHFDHIGALDAVRKKYDIPVYIHELEEDALLESELNLSSITDKPFTTNPAEKIIYSEGPCSIGPFHFDIKHTPGHSVGSISFIFNDEKVVVSGDVLFRENIGRTDLGGGGHHVLLQSIHEKLMVLDDDFQVFPGHGMSTTIGHERQSNPFLKNI